MKPNSYLVAEVVVILALLACAVLLVITGYPAWAAVFVLLTAFVKADKDA